MIFSISHSMQAIKQGDVVVVAFPFSSFAEMKMRPALVISNGAYNRYRNVLLAGIYGKEPPCSIKLTNNDLREKKLSKTSYISLQNLVSIEKTAIVKTVDSLSTHWNAIL